jgi:hypothetical protein
MLDVLDKRPKSEMDMSRRPQRAEQTSTLLGVQRGPPPTEP